MSLLSEADLSLPPHMSETERLRSVITVKDACIANFSTTLRSIEKKAAVERETLEAQIADLEIQVREMRAYALENSTRARDDGASWFGEVDVQSRSGIRGMDGASTPGEIQARLGTHSPRDVSGEVHDLREKFTDMEKEKNKMEGRVLRAEASSADLLKELRSTYFQLDKTRAQLQEVMNSSDSRSPPPFRPAVDPVASMSFEQEQQYQREIAELQLALRRAREEITKQARYGADILEEGDDAPAEPLREVGRDLDLLARLMGITNTDQLPVGSKISVLKTQVETWRDQREKEGKLLEESKQGMVELLNEFKKKDEQLKEAQAVIAGKGKIFLSKSKTPAKDPSSGSRTPENHDPGTVGFTISGQPPYDILEITHLIDRNGTPQGTPGCLNRTVVRGDRLLQVGGLDVSVAPMSALRAALGGPVDSCVSLRLFRPSSGDFFDITARRHVLMSPRSRAAAGRQLPVSPRSLVGSIPVSPRSVTGSLPVSPRNNLNSGSSGPVAGMPVSPRSLETVTAGGMSPRTAGSLPMGVSGLGALQVGGPMPPAVTLSHGAPGSAAATPTGAMANLNRAAGAGVAGPGVAVTPSAAAAMMQGLPGQWSPPARQGLSVGGGSLASAHAAHAPSYLPRQAAGTPGTAYAPSHALGSLMHGTPSQGLQAGVPGLGGSPALASHISPDPTPPSAIDPWTFDDNDGNIWTTNPGNPSLVLT